MDFFSSTGCMFLRDFAKLFTMAASTANERFTSALAEIAEYAEREPEPALQRGYESGLWDSFLDTMFDESIPRYRSLDLQILKLMYNMRVALNDYSKRDERANGLKTKLMSTFTIFLKHHMEADLTLILQCFNTFRVVFDCPYPKDSLKLLRGSLLKINNGNDQEGKDLFCRHLNILSSLVKESSEETEYKLNCQVIEKGLEIFSGANPKTAAPLLLQSLLMDYFTFGCHSGVFKRNAELAQRSMEMYLGIIQNQYQSSLKERSSAVKDLELCWSALDKLEFFYSLEILSTAFSVAKYPDGCEAMLWLGRRTMNLSRNRRSAHIANLEGVKMDYLEKLIRVAVVSCRNDPDAPKKLLSTNLVVVTVDMMFELSFDSFIYELMGYLFLADTRGVLQCYVPEMMKSLARTADDVLSFPGVLSTINIDSFIVLLSILAKYSPSSASNWTDMDCALYKLLEFGFQFPDTRIYVVHTMGNVCWEQRSMLATMHIRERLMFGNHILVAWPPYSEDTLRRMTYQVGYLQVLFNFQKYKGMERLLKQPIVVKQVTIAAIEAVAERSPECEHRDRAMNMMRLVLCVLVKYCRRSMADLFEGSDMHKILLRCLELFLDDDQIVEYGLWVMYLMCKDDRQQLEKYTSFETQTVMRVMRLVHKKWSDDPKVGIRIREFGKLLYEVGGLFIMV